MCLNLKPNMKLLHLLNTLNLYLKRMRMVARTT